MNIYFRSGINKLMGPRLDWGLSGELLTPLKAIGDLWDPGAVFFRSCQTHTQVEGVCLLFLPLELAFVESLRDRLAAMQHGVIVKQGRKDQILRNPKIDCTKRLIAAVPVPDSEEQARRRAS